MSKYVVIRPQDDAAAIQASDWCDALCVELNTRGHTPVADLHGATAANATSIAAALRRCVLVFYFGHGTPDEWQTAGAATLDATSVSAAKGIGVVAVACETGAQLGADAVTAGAVAWLGFTCAVPAVRPHRNQDDIGDALVRALKVLGNKKSFQEARMAIYTEFDALAAQFRNGSLTNHPAAGLCYFASLCLRDQAVVHGNPGYIPL